jgi:TetR/AcrR family transcriptional repressor of nem operon
MGRPKEFEPDAAVGQAMELFWRKGYGSTTPQDLVETLGIGKGSLYNAFTSKHGLFELALRRYGDRKVAALTELLDSPGPVKPLLRGVLRQLALVDPDDPRPRGCLATNTMAELAGSDEVATDLVRGIFDRIEGTLQAAVERGQRAGEIDASRDPRDIASLLLGVLVGMNVLAKAAEGPERLSRIVDAALAGL